MSYRIEAISVVMTVLFEDTSPAEHRSISFTIDPAVDPTAFTAAADAAWHQSFATMSQKITEGDPAAVG